MLQIYAGKFEPNKDMGDCVFERTRILSGPALKWFNRDYIDFSGRTVVEHSVCT